MQSFQAANTFIESENNELKMLSTSKQRSLESEHNKLKTAHKKIENLEELNQELSTINERYRLENDKLLEARETLQNQMVGLSAAVSETQCEVQQLREERALQMCVAEENSALKQEMAAFTAQSQGQDKSGMLGLAGQVDPAHMIRHTFEPSTINDLMLEIGPGVDRQCSSSGWSTASRFSTFSAMSARFGSSRRVLAMPNIGTPKVASLGTLSTLYSPTSAMIEEDDEQATQTQSIELEAARKSLEIEMRQTMQREFDERLEVKAQQVKVDCRVELQREKERYAHKVAELEGQLVRRRDKEVALRVQHEREMAECRERLKVLERRKGNRAMRYAEVSDESDEDAKEEDKEQQELTRRSRAKRLQRQTDEGCKVCAIGSWAKMFE